MKHLEWIKNGTFAHRGLHDNVIPENSMKAFREAIKHGYDIELDIHMTKDRKLVCIHDNNLLRLCGVNHTVHSLTYDELSLYRLKETDEKIMLLSEVLHEIPETVKLLIELKKSKNDKFFVQEFIRITKEDTHTFAVHSFQPGILRYFKKYAPSMIRGYIMKSHPTKNELLNAIIRHLPIISYIEPDFINHRFEDLPNKRMDRLKAKGVLILSYTARSQKALDYIRNRYDNAVFEGFKAKK